MSGGCVAVLISRVFVGCLALVLLLSSYSTKERQLHLSRMMQGSVPKRNTFVGRDWRPGSLENGGCLASGPCALFLPKDWAVTLFCPCQAAVGLCAEPADLLLCSTDSE